MTGERPAQAFATGRGTGKPRSRSAELMNALDKINTTMGRGTVRLARVPVSSSWAMKQQLKSPGYTCRWGELPQVR